MKKVRNGIKGELTAEIFETCFPDKPEVILLDFIKTNQPRMMIIMKLDDNEYMVSHITQNYAKRLLEEFKILRGNK